MIKRVGVDIPLSLTRLRATRGINVGCEALRTHLRGLLQRRPRPLIRCDDSRCRRSDYKTTVDVLANPSSLGVLDMIYIEIRAALCRSLETRCFGSFPK